MVVLAYVSEALFWRQHRQLPTVAFAVHPLTMQWGREVGPACFTRRAPAVQPAKSAARATQFRVLSLCTMYTSRMPSSRT